MNDSHQIKKILPFAEYRHSTNSGRHYKQHIHKTFSIGAIDKGEVIYQVDGQKANLRPGNLALINPETLHSCNPTKSQMRSYYVLYLDIDWCLQLQQSLWKIDAFSPTTNILLDDDLIYRQFIDTMISLIDDIDILEKEEKLADIVTKIFLLACSPGIEESETPAHIDKLKNLLSLNLNKELTMNDLASELEVNPFTLLRQFKALTGITPHAYRLNCKIELAKELLRKKHDIPTVALQCGFFDQSHFHRHFKAITTITPKEYQVNFIQ